MLAPLPGVSVLPSTGLPLPIASRPPSRLLALARALEHLLDDAEVGADEIAVFVAMARHADEAGTCHPSQGTIADYLQRSRPWVNARVKRLGDLGIVNRRRHHLSKGGETSCRYQIPLLDVTGATAQPTSTIKMPLPVSGKEMVVVLDADLPACVDDTGLVPPSSEASEPDRESAGANPDGQGAGPETAVSPLPVSEIDGAAVPGSDTACPDGGTPCPVDDTNLLNTISTPHQPEGRKARACASGHRPDRGHEIESLIGRIQQAAVSPWRSETARRAVFDAVAVVGVERISALAVGFKGAGLRPWEIIKRLEALSIPAPSASQPQPSRPVKVMALQGDAAPTNPAVQVALGILSGADFGTRLRWFKRAGLSVSMSRYSAWVPQIAVEFLADEYPRTYGQFACAA